MRVVLNFIFIGLIILRLYYLYKKLKKKYICKIKKTIKNERLVKLIDTFLIPSLSSIALLGIAILLSIFLPNVEDREILVGLISNILCAILGLIGSLIGVIATYEAFYLGIDVEKNRNIEHKRIMLYNLLNYSIIKTSFLYEKLNIHYNVQINSAFSNGVPIDKIFERYSNSCDIKRNLYNDLDMIKSIECDYEQIKTLKKSLNIYFNRILEGANLNDLIYDNNWCSYIDCINDLKSSNEKIKIEEDIETVIDWLNYLKSTSKRCNSDGFIVNYSSLEFINKRKKVEDLITRLK